MQDTTSVQPDPWERTRLIFQQGGHDPLTPRGLFKVPFDLLLDAWSAVVADVEGLGSDNALLAAQLRVEAISEGPVCFLDSRVALESAFPHAIRVALIWAMHSGNRREWLQHEIQIPYSDARRWDGGNWISENLDSVGIVGQEQWEPLLDQASEDEGDYDEGHQVLPWPVDAPVVRKRLEAIDLLFEAKTMDGQSATACLKALYRMLDYFLWEYFQWGTDVYALHYGFTGQGAHDLHTGRRLAELLGLPTQLALFDRALAGDFQQDPEHWEVAYEVARRLLAADEPDIAGQIADRMGDSRLARQAAVIVKSRVAVKRGDFKRAEALVRELDLKAGDSGDSDDAGTTFGNPREWIEKETQALKDYVEGARDAYTATNQTVPAALEEMKEWMTAKFASQFRLTVGVGQKLQDGQTRIEVGQDKVLSATSDISESLHSLLAKQEAMEQSTSLLTIELIGLHQAVREQEWERTVRHFWELWLDRASGPEKESLEDRGRRKFGDAVWNKVTEESRRDLMVYLLIREGVRDSERASAFALLTVVERELRYALQRSGMTFQGHEGFGELVANVSPDHGNLREASARIARGKLVAIRNDVVHGKPFDGSHLAKTEGPILNLVGSKSLLALIVLHRPSR